MDNEIRKDISSLFASNKMSLVLDKANQTLCIMQAEENENDVFLLSFNLISDSLRRFIFFKSAVASNENSVILFDSPEAYLSQQHCSQLIKSIIEKRNNQYFIATYSPVILNDFLENCRQDLAVYMVSYKNDLTTVRQLTPDELNDENLI